MEIFLEWVWNRHHNVLSWYVRPLFIFPFCYFAYKRKLNYLLVVLLIFPTTLFWFPAPEEPSQKVLEYLSWEQEFLTQGIMWQKALMIFLVVVFLFLLALSFWKRSLLYGVVVLNIGTLLKVVWSIYFGGSVGHAAILPSVVTLAVCNFVFWLIYKYKVKSA